MNDKVNFSKEAPVSFALCFRTDCVSADHCLRSLAARDLGKERTTLYIINPNLVNPKGGNTCRFFQSSEKVKIAYGFKWMMDHVPSGRIWHIRDAICSMISQRTYYYLMDGTKPILLDMQRKIGAILRANGLSVPILFDRYEECYLW